MNEFTNKKMEDWSTFILRKIDSDGVEVNTMLGGFYSLTLKERSPKQFDDITIPWQEHGHNIDSIYGVVSFFDHSTMPLYEGATYYIMTDVGSTVANISKK